MKEDKTNSGFMTREEIEAAVGQKDCNDINDEEERAVFNHKARQRERRREAEKKVRARLDY